MKATGIVRRVDDLGRIVIPKEIRWHTQGNHRKPGCFPMFENVLCHTVKTAILWTNDLENPGKRSGKYQRGDGHSKLHIRCFWKNKKNCITYRKGLFTIFRNYFNIFCAVFNLHIVSNVHSFLWSKKDTSYSSDAFNSNVNSFVVRAVTGFPAASRACSKSSISDEISAGAGK